MRILLITGEFPPMQGGVGDYTREMSRSFIAQGHEVNVLVSSALRVARRDGDDGFRVFPAVPDWKWGCWRRIRDVVYALRPDVVNIQYQAAAYDMRVPAINLLPWWLHRQEGCPPLVVTFHDLKPPYLFPKAGPLRTWVVRALARHSDAAIVTNVEDLLIARSWFPPHKPTRPHVHHIPIGSNIAVAPPAAFERAAWRARLGCPPNCLLLAYFGFLNESKGGDTLIYALASLVRRWPDDGKAPPRLLMIGGRVGSSDPTNQAYAAHVDSLIRQLGLTELVRCTGYVPPAEVSAALLSADVVLLPYRDGVSFRRGSLHAALAHGCAIVTTTPRVPIPELRDGENVLLVPPDDPESLAAAALRLHHDPALRQRIGAGARALAQQFTWDKIARRTVTEVFRPLCEARGSRPA